ncbi:MULTISPECIES: carbonic anhydrase [unclassified Clostridium]|uniref:beta-class carbonic anhydrase n=1 Tax=unclassified Clostridium TaxID=2614128 RepID=UPI001C8C1C58|nr:MULTISPECIES: carbonic anhydrase [unclassified Clostridium]MBX9139112.1 carbonic anhydrase [Clostridium sp. K12(2020)]MBX9145888.1 carbonic anhydrase [Clostridium sp. K13]MDU4325078.1 carbonic anhydrase [Clostridium celatum]
MNKLDEILEFNKDFVENREYEKYKSSKYPDKKLVILSCMDTRLTELLPKALNLRNGDAKIVKNAGATIIHPFGSIIRSIIVAIYEFDTDEVLVIGHKNCGMSNINGKETINKIINRGVTKETIETLNNSGIDIKKWLHGFDSVEESVKESVELIKKHPLIPRDIKVHGLIMDSESGKLEVITKDY